MHEGGQRHAGARAEGQGPAQGVDRQALIAGIADGAAGPGGDKFVSRLDRHQAAEAAAERPDGPAVGAILALTGGCEGKTGQCCEDGDQRPTKV